MNLRPNSFPKVEDIMTPRSLFKCVDEQESHSAKQIADENNFDVVPLLRRGEIQSFWSREANRVLPITKRHRVSHDTRVEEALPRINEHGVQFVHYRSQIVGLVDISDLNKPLARLAWIRPILECEQALLSRAQEGNFTEDEIAKALGHVAKDVRKRQRKAHRENLDLPLLSFAYFGDLLKATVKLGLVHLADDEIKRINSLRNRLAHGGRELIEKRSDGEELVWALGICHCILKVGR